MNVNLSFKIFFCLFFALFLTKKTFSQKKKYSTEEIEEYKIKPLNHKTLKEFHNILIENKSTNGWTNYYSKFAYYMAYLDKADSAIFYANKALSSYENLVIKKESEESRLLNSYFALGRAYGSKKQHQESLKYYLKYLELEKKYPNPLALTYIKVGIAISHLELGNDSISLKLYKEVYKDTNYIKSGRSKSTTEMRIGILYGSVQNKQLDSAIHYFHKAKNTSLKKGITNNLVSIYHNLGDSYRYKNRDSAIYYYEKAYQLHLDPKYRTLSVGSIKARNLFSKVNYSYVKIQRGKTKEAIADINNVLESLNKESAFDKNDKGIFLSCYDNLILAYKAQGDYEKMQQAYEQKEQFLIVFNEEQMSQALEKLQVSYQTKEKEEEITRLEFERKNQIIIQRQQKYISISIISLLLLFLGVLGYYIKQQNLINNYKESVLKQQLLRTQMDPHFFFNALNQVIVLNKLNPAKVQPYILELSKLTRLILENSREEYVLLEKEIEALEKFMVLESNFSKQFTYDIKIDEEVDTSNLLIPPMMIQPLVENAIIHGILKSEKTGEIAIHFKTDTLKTLLCIITDNGAGYKAANTNKLKSHTSLSQKILEERLELYHKKRKKKNYLQISSNTAQNAASKGTRVQLVLPVEF